MKKNLLSLGTALFFAIQSLSLLSQTTTTIQVFDTLTYYDGYAALVTNPPAPSGTIRFRNDLYSRKLNANEIASIGTTLDLKVTIGALCDDYDRIGSVNLALVPKGSATYVYDSVPHIEIARYITPFFNKNVNPTSVPYQWSIDNVAVLLKDSGLTAMYDFWIELQVFGVPYAANTEVAGCSGRNDVFHGSLQLITDTAAATQNNNVLIPVSFFTRFNNYDSTATDTVGKTTRTYHVNVPGDMSDAAFYLITSNHGANQNGEEYNRRMHYVYVDDSLRLQYKPGRTSCEPFRQYNTMPNGIYGQSPRTNAQWQSFSNWCPGDIIDIRKIELGAVEQGDHVFTINVPTAVFAGGQGNIPLSVYFQGKRAPVAVGIKTLTKTSYAFSIYPSPAKELITLANKTGAAVRSIRVVDMLGVTVYQSGAENFETKSISVSEFTPGIYTVLITTSTGSSTRKIQVFR